MSKCKNSHKISNSKEMRSKSLKPCNNSKMRPLNSKRLLRLINSSRRMIQLFTTCSSNKSKKSSRNKNQRLRYRKTRKKLNKRKLMLKLRLLHNRTRPKILLRLFLRRNKTQQSTSAHLYQMSLSNILPNRKLRSLQLKNNLRLQSRTLPAPRLLKSKILPIQLRKQRPNLPLPLHSLNKKLLQQNTQKK